MEVFLTCSTDSIQKYAKNYRTIRDRIIELGHSINKDWIDYSINLTERGVSQSFSPAFYEDVIAAILTADAIVADASVQTMTLGQQISHALQNNKPTLLLIPRSAKGNGEGLFIEALKSKYLDVYKYASLAEADKVLKAFFKKIEDRPKKRFNLVLTETLNNYINWASFYYKKTKTDIIHEAIEKSQERDSSYKKYLSRRS